MRILLLFLLLAGCAASAPDAALNWRKLDNPIVVSEGEQITYMAGQNKTYYLRYEVGPSAKDYGKIDTADHAMLSDGFKRGFAPYMCSTSPYQDKLNDGYSYEFLVHKENQFKYTIARFEVSQPDCP